MYHRPCLKALALLAGCLLVGGLATLVAAQQPKDGRKLSTGRIEKRTYEFKEAEEAAKWRVVL